MKRMSATEAKNGFGCLLDTAKVEPFVVERQGRGVVVVLSLEEYQRLKALDEKVTSSDVAKLPGSPDRKPFLMLHCQLPANRFALLRHTQLC